MGWELKFSVWAPSGGGGELKFAIGDAGRAVPGCAVLVHHVWFWRGEDGRVTGIRKTRLQTLLRHDINLIAYHLPLDSHPELGNNAQLARRFGWLAEARFGEQDLGWLGRIAKPMTLSEVAQRVSHELQRVPLRIGDG